MLFFALLTIALKLGTVFAEDETGLLFLQIIFRHGDRAALGLYPKDPNPLSAWPEGLGKLTNLGKRQHYMLGKHIRSMYPNFITSHPNEVSVSSSEVDRCLRSAQSHLAGLYEPDPNWTFHESIKWQPIPVNYLPRGVEQALNFDYNCPRANELEDNHRAEAKEEYKNLFQELSEKSGANVTGLWEALMLFDTLFAEKQHNLEIPDWVDGYWKDLEEIADSFFYDSSPIRHKLRAGPLLERFINTITLKLNGSLPEQRVQVYSTHDEVTALLLSALGLYNGKRPPYASTLILELREGHDKENLIRILYLNSTNPENGEQPSHVLKLEGCSELCPLDYFKSFTKDLIPGNLANECNI